jgi:CRP-like cAMP-binding protein
MPLGSSEADRSAERIPSPMRMPAPPVPPGGGTPLDPTAAAAAAAPDAATQGYRGERRALVGKARSGTASHEGSSARTPLDLADITRASLFSAKEVVGALRTAPEFERLTEAQVAMLAQGGEWRRVPRYTQIYREGSAAHSFYVLLNGRIQHSSFSSPQQHTISAPTEKDEGVCFGTEGLSQPHRFTTVTTLDECLLLRFSTHRLRIDEGGLDRLAERASTAVISAALRANTFFAEASEETMQTVAPLFSLQEVGCAGTTIIEEGGASDIFCVLLEGSVAISSASVRIGVLPAEEDDPEPLFGESAILSIASSTMTVTTLEPCKLLVLPRTKFRKLLRAMPDLREAIRGYSLLRKSFIAAALSANEMAGARDHPSGSFSSHRGGGTEDGDSQELAARRIQAAARGRQARQRVQEIRSKRASLGLRIVGGF